MVALAMPANELFGLLPVDVETGHGHTSYVGCCRWAVPFRQRAVAPYQIWPIAPGPAPFGQALAMRRRIVMRPASLVNTVACRRRFTAAQNATRLAFS